jgi:hypothetical protein
VIDQAADEARMVSEDEPPPEYAANVPRYDFLGEYRGCTWMAALATL